MVPTGKQKTNHEIMLKDNNVKVGKDDTAHFINNYFINVGKCDLPSGLHDTVNNPQLLDDSSDGDGSWVAEELKEISEIEVFNVVKHINVSKSSGIDNISSFVIKEAFGFLVREVTYMFNQSIRTSKFPDAWKQALVVPIPKVGNLNNVKNFRPISLLPLPGKILEKIVHQQLTNHLDMYSVITDNQHGFRKKHSTIHSSPK